MLEAVARRFPVKKVSLNIFHNSLKNIHAAVFNKILGKRFATLLKRGSSICALIRIPLKF